MTTIHEQRVNKRSNISTKFQKIQTKIPSTQRIGFSILHFFCLFRLRLYHQKVDHQYHQQKMYLKYKILQ
jgi:hypothetical protein